MAKQLPMEKKNINSFFTDKNTFRRVDSYRIMYFMIAILAFLITEAGRFIYRPFIYANQINDLGLADSIGNLGGVIVQIFVMLAFFNSQNKKAFRVIGFLVVGYILYEILQPYLPKGVFDWKDVWGTIIGGLIATLIVLVKKKLIRKNKVIYKF
jgi:hypothetical protein